MEQGLRFAGTIDPAVAADPTQMFSLIDLTLTADVAINDGEVVTLMQSDQSRVIKAGGILPSNEVAPVLGVAMQTVVSDDLVRVMILGRHPAVRVLAGVTSGQALFASTTAGKGGPTAANGPVGLALSNEAGGFAQVWVNGALASETTSLSALITTAQTTANTAVTAAATAQTAADNAATAANDAANLANNAQGTADSAKTAQTWFAVGAAADLSVPGMTSAGSVLRVYILDIDLVGGEVTFTDLVPSHVTAIGTDQITLDVSTAGHTVVVTGFAA